MLKYFIKTYGCQMNQNDSETIAGIMEALGFGAATSETEADIIFVNTCSVRDLAEQKARSYLGRLKELKDQNSQLKIALVGCMAERLKGKAKSRFPHIDLLLGPNDIVTLPDQLSSLFTYYQPGFPHSPLPITDQASLPAKRLPSPSAWITIIQGCDSFCTYCIVPSVRGREAGWPKDMILKEIAGLDKNIFKEVILLGQNVANYNDHGFRLQDLLYEVAKIPGILRIRFLTSHPKDTTIKLIEAVKNNPKVCAAFHLPLQSGDDEILKQMNRGYILDDYRKLISNIRSRIPEAAITTDLIVGFPGETDKQFQNTLSAVKEFDFDLANTAVYSPRPGTPAAQLADPVPRNVKKARLSELNKLIEKIAFDKNQKLVAKTVEVLVEGTGIGRTRTNKIVQLGAATNSLLGKLVNVKIISAKSWILEGEANHGQF